MPTQELSGTTALVTGASRGFGRAIAVALSEHGAHVAGVARDPGRLEELHAQLGGTFTPVAAVAAGPVVAGQLLDKYGPARWSSMPEQPPAALVTSSAAAHHCRGPEAGTVLTGTPEPSRATPGALARPKLGP